MKPGSWSRGGAWAIPLAGSLALALALAGALAWLVPDPLFQLPYSTVALDRDGGLLGATVASDGQWRFVPASRVPERFALALMRYEDRRFLRHGGVDPLALARAVFLNLRAGEVRSGGSTLSMQLARLAQGNQGRTLDAKLREGVQALAIEALLDKSEILAQYAAHAPFGGNVVGLEAASWRYFGRAPAELSWAEAACLAVLPNSPGLIHPGRSTEQLRAKRDRLLGVLRAEGLLHEDDYRLALAESLPRAPERIPQESALLVQTVRQIRRAKALPVGYTWRSAIDPALQAQATRVLARHAARLRGNGIQNAAALILEVKSGQVLAWVGNVPPAEGIAAARDWNDMVLARRSTGSLLKPFLYAAQLEAGEILPGQLVADIPTSFQGFAPDNYDRSNAGAVRADQALARSLNIPAVRNLQNYGLHRFYRLLKGLGLTSLFRSADQYGLPLILGGAEGTLWELCNLYADLARSQDPAARGKASGRWVLPGLDQPASAGKGGAAPTLPAVNAEAFGSDSYPFGPAAAWLTLQAMSQLARPAEEAAWEDFLSARPLAWKTGTSFGYRDAWAIGVNARFAIGVWVGNASGEARPELRGAAVAAPVLFELLSALPAVPWFEAPAELRVAETCADSGQLAGPDCARRVRQLVPPRGLSSQVCPYCRTVHLSPDGRHQADARLYPVAQLRSERRFVLPPQMEWYYRRSHPEYRPLPPWDPRLPGLNGPAPFSLIQPESGARIFVPVDLEGQPGMMVLLAAHRDPRERLFWHLDGEYLGMTRELHQMELRPRAGSHLLTLVDAQGRSIERRFTVLSD